MGNSGASRWIFQYRFIIPSPLCIDVILYRDPLYLHTKSPKDGKFPNPNENPAIYTATFYLVLYIKMTKYLHSKQNINLISVPPVK